MVVVVDGDGDGERLRRPKRENRVPVLACNKLSSCCATYFCSFNLDCTDLNTKVPNRNAAILKIASSEK